MDAGHRPWCKLAPHQAGLQRHPEAPCGVGTVAAGQTLGKHHRPCSVLHQEQLSAAGWIFLHTGNAHPKWPCLWPALSQCPPLSHHPLHPLPHLRKARLTDLPCRTGLCWLLGPCRALPHISCPPRPPAPYHCRLPQALGRRGAEACVPLCVTVAALWARPHTLRFSGWTSGPRSSWDAGYVSIRVGPA